MSRHTKTPAERTVRIGRDDLTGASLYAIERLRPAPTFHKGDGYDGGRNLLGALLIGPSYEAVGYVLGSRGAWFAYTNEDWRARGRRKWPLCQFGTRETVAAAADLLLFRAERVQL